MKKSLILSFIFGCSVIGTASAEVVEGVWNDEFTNSFAKAEAEHRPLVMIWGKQGCMFCDLLWKSLQEGSTFSAWAEEHKCMFVHKQDNIDGIARKKWKPDNYEASKWIESYSKETGRHFDVPPGWDLPIVAVYWPKADGTDSHAFFVGRDGVMPVKDGTLEEQFTESVDSIVGDFGPKKLNFGARTLLIPAEEKTTQAMPFPCDLDGDGLLDMLVGVKIATGTNATGKTTYVGKVRVYRNVGTADRPAYSWTNEYLTVNGEVLAEDQGTTGGCQGLQAQFGDYNGDGFRDLVVGHLAGELEVYPGTATPGVYGQKVDLLPTAAGGAQRTYGRFYDADGDGREELYVGFMDGTFKRFDYSVESNGWTTNDVIGVEGTALRLPPQSQTNNRRSTPAFLDVDGDGFVDLVSGSTDGGIYYFPGKAAGSWSTNCVLCVAGETKMERSRLAIDDLNGDGVGDLVAGFESGYVAWNEGSYGIAFSCTPAEAYVPGVKIEPVRVSVTPAKYKPVVTVGKLPKGLSFAPVGSAYYITGTPTEPFDGDLTFTTAYVKGGVRESLVSKVPFVVLPLRTLELKEDDRSTGSGSWSGAGNYLAGKTVKVVAKPSGKSVFAGWYLAGEPFAGNSADYRLQTISLTVPTNALTTLTARFASKDEDASGLSVGCEPPVDGFAAGVPVIPLPVAVESLSSPKLTARGLPAGLKLDAAAFCVVGTPTKPGVYTTTFSASNKSGAKAATNVTFVVRNFVDEEIPVEDSYGPFVPGEPIELPIAAAAGCSASGLPSGLKFDKATGLVRGTPKKPGVSVVTFTKKVNRVACDRKASATFVVGPYPVLAVAAVGAGGGTVKGAGSHAANAKVTLTAKADGKSAFAGWYDGDELLSQDANFKLVMPAADLTLTARFVTREEDAASVALAVDGRPLSSGEEVVCSNYCGVAVDWPVAASAESAVTVKMSGQPSGLKLQRDKLTGDYAVVGAPTKASSVVKGSDELKPSTLKLTVTTAGKSTKSYVIRMYVLPRPNWAVGSYDGGVRCETGSGTVTATIAANGKVSGKYAIGKKSYSFSLSALSDVTEDGGFGADVQVKIASGVVLDERLVLTPQAIDGESPEIGAAVSAKGAQLEVVSNAVQNIWKRSDAVAFELPTFAKNASSTLAFEDPEFGPCELSFKFGAKGKVTVAGFIGEKKASATAQLLIDSIGPSPCLCFARSFNGRIVVAVKSLGFCRTFGFSGDADVTMIGTSDIVLENWAE